MTEVYLKAMSRSVMRIGCLTSTGVPAGVPAGAIVPTANSGLLKVSSDLDPVLTAHTGAPYKVKIVPGSTSSQSYTLAVYGAFSTAGDPVLYPGTQGPWLWVPLFIGTVAATLAYTGAAAPNVLTTSDFLAATVTATAGGSGEATVTSYGAAYGAAHVTVPTHGAPYLLFESSAAGGFVLASGLS